MLDGVAAILVLVAALLAPSVLGASQAAASETYGEVTRFGGYDATGKTAGKFVMPVGFAVEPENPFTHETNAVYVLDRTVSNPANGELDYRLQKFSSTGSLLGSATIDESYTDKTLFSDAHPLVDLAVDPASKRVYSVVESMVESASEQYVPVAGELVAWSNEPNGGKIERADPSELSADTITKGSASVVAGSSVLLPEPVTLSEVLYAPAGLVVEQSSPGTAGQVVIEAQHGVKGISGTKGGQTVLQRVIASGGSAGTLGETRFVGRTGLSGAGIFAATDGSGDFGTHLYNKLELQSLILTLPGEFTNGSETELAEAAQEESKEKDADQVVSFDAFSRPNEGSKGVSGLEVYAAGGQVTQLYDPEHLYAALYSLPSGGPKTEEGQSDVEPWKAVTGPGNKASLRSWMTGSPSDEGWANMGVRLFEADGTIVDTIGGGKPVAAANAEPSELLGSCDIDYQAASIAAGADGSVFVLTQENKETSPTSGDEVIEFAPGGTHSCPSMTGNIEVNGAEVHAQSGEPLAKVTVGAGVETKFDAISLDKQLTWNPTDVKIILGPGQSEPFEWSPEPFEWQPFAFEWNFGDEPSGGPNHDGYTVINKIEEGSEKNYLWPSPEAEHEYKTDGTYEAKVRVYSDLGTRVFPVEVKVPSSEPPKALFAVPSSVMAGKPVVFDASDSTPALGAEINDYTWEFNDGTMAENTPHAKFEHTFATAGEYSVKLTVHDHEGSEKEAAITHKVIVEAAPVVGKEKEEPKTEQVSQPKSETQPKTETPSGKTETTPITKPVLTKPTTKPLTTAQKLANALKACKKLKSKKQRASCEKQAKKKYATKPKKSTKKKK